MSPQIKSILLILLTLAIGFAGGFMTHGKLVQNRFEQVRTKMGKSNGHIEYMAGVLELTEEQKVIVQPILEEFAPKMHKQHRQFRSEVKVMMDSLSEELSPHVTEDQLDKLKKRFHRNRPRKSKSRN